MQHRAAKASKSDIQTAGALFPPNPAAPRPVRMLPPVSAASTPKVSSATHRTALHCTASVSANVPLNIGLLDFSIQATQEIRKDYRVTTRDPLLRLAFSRSQGVGRLSPELRD